jgi:flagellar biosynthesis component FlhA
MRNRKPEIFGKSGVLYGIACKISVVDNFMIICISTKRKIKMKKISLYKLYTKLPPVDAKLIKEFREYKGKEEATSIEPSDLLRLEIGFGLIPLVSGNSEPELLARLERMRKESTFELRISYPSIRIVDNQSLKNYEYCFKINGKVFGKYTLLEDKYL